MTPEERAVQLIEGCINIVPVGWRRKSLQDKIADAIRDAVTASEEKSKLTIWGLGKELEAQQAAYQQLKREAVEAQAEMQQNIDAAGERAQRAEQNLQFANESHERTRQDCEAELQRLTELLRVSNESRKRIISERDAVIVSPEEMV